MDLLLHFKVNEGDENNINIQEYMLYGDVETKSEKCLVDEGDEVVLTEFPVPEFKNCTLMKKGDEGFYEYKDYRQGENAEDKSRILPFGRYKGTKESFDFLGFTHYNAKSHWGKYCVLHRTSKKKLKMKREAIKKWLWEHMHESIKDTIEALNVRLTGHYRYYGIYGNFVGLLKFYKYVLVELRKSKRRRDQTNWLTWNKYINILKIHPLECPKIYLNSAY